MNYINNIPWFEIAVLILILELFTGTIYLLIIAFSFFITGLLYVFNISTNNEINLIIFSIISIIGLVGFYFINKYFLKNRKHKKHKELDNLNIGKTVFINEIKENGELYVKYQGTFWQAKLNKESNHNEKLIGKKATIIGQQANLLIIELTNN